MKDDTSPFMGMGLGTLIIMMISFALLLQIPVPVLAHSPSEMQLAFDDGSRQLSVTLTHQVPDPNSHYVKEVSIRVNGYLVSDLTYTNQPSPSVFTYTYPLESRAGAEIEVLAQCSIGGSITRGIRLTNNSPVISPEQDGLSIPKPTKSTPSIIVVPVTLALLVVISQKSRVVVSASYAGTQVQGSFNQR